MHVLNRLADAFGIEGVTVPMRSFPTAATIVHSNPDAMRALGLSRPKGEYLIGLARMAIDPNDRDFASIATLANDDALARLLKIRGVGRWTAEYVLLRGFGRIDIFPGDDVGGRNKLFEWFGTDGEPTYAGVLQMLKRWHPYAGLIYLHLVVNAATGGGNLAQSAV
jgi:DNA-3-methyladenine glycosylase II